jgi:predicted aconitase
VNSGKAAVELTAEDRAWLTGEHGEGAALAMRLVVTMAEVARAPRLRDITRAHVDSCLYHGQAGLDFAERLLGGGATVAIPATLNVSSLDLLHPELVRLDDETRGRAKRLMDTYVAMGCRPTWTCAPYQLPDRPAFGEHVAWAESNAIVFANSVLGARTNRYGDFIDICAAVTGRVPDHGLHTDEGRRATLLLRLEGLPDRLLDHDLLAPVLGHLLGRRAGNEVTAIEGLPADTTEDRLKAIGAAAASSGSVALFHAIGVTPEAPTWETVAVAGAREEPVTLADLRSARDELSPVPHGSEIGAVSVGTPHASVGELRRLVDLVREERPRVPFYVNTGRAQLAAVGSVAEDLADAGVTVVTDTCTYITPILHDVTGPVMTDSGKWAWYAPSNLGCEVALGSLQECVRSAAAGVVIRDSGPWVDR